jgi:Domain of unknown function (DUF927)/Cch helix turn helix domain
MTDTPNADAFMGEHDPEPPGKQAIAGLELPDGYVIPAPYVVEPGGVFVEKPSKEGETVTIRVTWGPLLPVRVYTDPGGDQLVELVWRDGPRWVRRLVPRSVAKSGRKLVAVLGDANLPVTDADAKAAERWLAAVEQANRDVIPREHVARQLGWQPDGQFVTAHGAPYTVEPKYDEQRGALNAHRKRGTLAGWQRAIRMLADFPAAQVGLYGGLAAPLLEPLGLDSFTVDISGRSTRGKTISVMCGASCFFDPSEQAEGMFHWRTTIIAVEKRLNLANGLPVVIDETRVVKSPELVDNVLYQVPKNHGTPRGGGWPSLLPWRTVALSTGEQPALSFTTHEGASARVLSVRRAPFGTDGEASERAARGVRIGITDNYGTAGPAFVARLRAMLAEDGGREELARRHTDLTEKFRGASDLSSRRAPLVACLYLAAELAVEWEIVPLAAPDPAMWLELFSAGEQDRNDNRPEMALDVVREFIASNSDKLWGNGDEHPPAAGWIGRDTKVDDAPAVALVPERLRAALKQAGYELEAVIPGWREMGALHEKAKQRPAHLIPQRIAGRRVRCYVFTAQAIEGGDDE